MKVVLTGFLTVFFLTTLSRSSLADTIFKEQKRALSQSQLKSAEGLFEGIETQKEFRNQYLNDITDLHKENKNDTIIIIEQYHFTCTGCPAYFVEINLHSQSIKYEMKMDGAKFGKYSRQVFKKNSEFSSADENIKIIIHEIRKGKNPNIEAYKYGTDDCYDGSHTMYTIIFPNNSMKCMYMRCWN
jgi:hypothetical protein